MFGGARRSQVERLDAKCARLEGALADLTTQLLDSKSREVLATSRVSELEGEVGRLRAKCAERGSEQAPGGPGADSNGRKGCARARVPRLLLLTPLACAGRTWRVCCRQHSHCTLPPCVRRRVRRASCGRRWARAGPCVASASAHLTLRSTALQYEGERKCREELEATLRTTVQRVKALQADLADANARCAALSEVAKEEAEHLTEAHQGALAAQRLQLQQEHGVGSAPHSLSCAV